MKNLLILGSEANVKNAPVILDFLSSCKRLGTITAGVLNPQCNEVLAQSLQISGAISFQFIEASEQNINNLDAIYIHDSNPYVIMHHLRSSGLFDPIRERAMLGLPIVAAGEAVQVLCPSLRTALSMPIIELDSLAALDLMPMHLQTGSLDALKKRALKEFFSFNKTHSVLFIPSESSISVRGKLALTGGDSGILKLVDNNEHFYKAKDYICL